MLYTFIVPGHVAQSVTCLTTDARLNADPGIPSSNRARSHGDWLWNIFYSHSPPFCWFIQDRLLSVTSESICTDYWLTACSSLPRKNCGWWPDRSPLTIAVDWDVKQQNQTNQNTFIVIDLEHFFNWISSSCFSFPWLFYMLILKLLHWIGWKWESNP